MKQRYIFILIFLSFSISGLSQEQKFSIRSGAGYYLDVFTANSGPIMWLEGGYKLNTGISISGRLSMATMEWQMDGGAFKGYKTFEIRQMADLIFSRPLKLKGKNFLEPGLGFKIKRDCFLRPDITEVFSDGTYYQYLDYNQIFYEIGFTLCLDYYYQFESNFYLGLRADSNVIWALGFEGLSVTPIFGFRF